jgi:hypothetical protein
MTLDSKYTTLNVLGRTVKIDQMCIALNHRSKSCTGNMTRDMRPVKSNGDQPKGAWFHRAQLSGIGS